MRHPVQAILLASTLALAPAAHADLVPWVLQGVTFRDGGTASGRFTFETTTRTFVDWDIATTPGTAPSTPFTTGFEFTPANSRPGNNQDRILDLIFPNAAGLQRRVFFAVDTATAGNFAGAVPVLPLAFEPFCFEASASANGNFFRFVSAGLLAVVPEPGAGALAAAGLAVLAALVRRRRGVPAVPAQVPAEVRA